MQNPATVEIELFNSSLVSLGTAQLTLTPAFNSPIFFGFTASEPVTRFRMTSNNAGFFMVDNFTFGSVVPEPAPFTLALLGAGMLWAVSNFARRRSNAAATIHKTKSVRP